PVADARQPVDSVFSSACSMGKASSSEVISTRAIRSRSRQRSGIGVAATGEGETILLRIDASKPQLSAYPIIHRAGGVVACGIVRRAKRRYRGLSTAPRDDAARLRSR